MALPDNAPAPRLCHIVKWSDFDGYGFNLHADKSRAGQYIGKVDSGSPAEASGLKEYDRIIEVNGVNISNENHKQVVQRIKVYENWTKLLVIDAEGDRWYKDHSLVIRSDQPNVIHGTSKKEDDDTSDKSSVKSTTEDVNGHEADNKSLSSTASSHSEAQPSSELESKPEIEPEVPTVPIPEKIPSDSEDEKVESNSNEIVAVPVEPIPEPVNIPETEHIEASESEPIHSSESNIVEDSQRDTVEATETEHIVESKSESSDKLSRSSSSSSNSSDQPSTATPTDLNDMKEDKSPMSITPSPPPSLDAEKHENGNAKVNSEESTKITESSQAKPDKSGLNLNMSVAEMKALLASRKKADPRNDTIDLKKKHQIIQNM